MGTKISDLPVTGVLPADAVFPLEYSGANYSVKASDLGTGGSGGWTSVPVGEGVFFNNNGTLDTSWTEVDVSAIVGTVDTLALILWKNDASTNWRNVGIRRIGDTLPATYPALGYGAIAATHSGAGATEAQVSHGNGVYLLAPVVNGRFEAMASASSSDWYGAVVGYMSGGSGGDVATDWVACNDPSYYGAGGHALSFHGLAVPHGLTSLPRQVTAQFKCTTTEWGWSVGDVVTIDGAEDTAGQRTVSIWADATDVNIHWYPKDHFLRVVDRSDGVTTRQATPANWSVRLVYTGGSGGGSSSSGTTSAILPFAHARIFTDNAGTGIGISWGAYNNGYVEVTFDTAQPDTDYYVVTDRETYDQHLIDIDQKTTSGFRTKWVNNDGSLVSPGTFGGMLTVYGSTPTIDIGGGSSSSGPRAYVAFDGTATNLTASITKSFNVDSITDNGVGFYRVNLTNAVTDAVTVASSKRLGSSISSTNTVVVHPEVENQTEIRIYCHAVDHNGNLGSYVDPPVVNLVVF